MFIHTIVLQVQLAQKICHATSKLTYTSTHPLGEQYNICQSKTYEHDHIYYTKPSKSISTKCNGIHNTKLIQGYSRVMSSSTINNNHIPIVIYGSRGHKSHLSQKPHNSKLQVNNLYYNSCKPNFFISFLILSNQGFPLPFLKSP